MAEREPLLPRFIDEIDRLFDQLVRDPWRSPPAARAPKPQQAPAKVPSSPGRREELLIEVPVPGAKPSDVTIAVEGQRLVVAIGRRVSNAEESVHSIEEQRFQQSFPLPPGAQVISLEARFEGEVLRVRVTLG